MTEFYDISGSYDIIKFYFISNLSKIEFLSLISFDDSLKKITFHSSSKFSSHEKYQIVMNILGRELYLLIEQIGGYDSQALLQQLITKIEGLVNTF